MLINPDRPANLRLLDDSSNYAADPDFFKKIINEKKLIFISKNAFFFY
jgi:hypothetical protein